MSTTMWHTVSEFYLWTLILFTFNNCVLLQKPSSGENPTFFNIGGVLSNSESERNFSETIAVSKRVSVSFWVVRWTPWAAIQNALLCNNLSLLTHYSHTPNLYDRSTSSRSMEYSLNWKWGAREECEHVKWSLMAVAGKAGGNNSDCRWWIVIAIQRHFNEFNESILACIYCLLKLSQELTNSTRRRVWFIFRSKADIISTSDDILSSRIVWVGQGECTCLNFSQLVINLLRFRI